MKIHILTIIFSIALSLPTFCQEYEDIKGTPLKNFNYLDEQPETKAVIYGTFKHYYGWRATGTRQTLILRNVESNYLYLLEVQKENSVKKNLFCAVIDTGTYEIVGHTYFMYVFYGVAHGYKMIADHVFTKNNRYALIELKKPDLFYIGKINVKNKQIYCLDEKYSTDLLIEKKYLDLKPGAATYSIPIE